MPTRPAAAALPLLLVGAILTWWAWKSGAYFDVVFLPGAIALLLLLVALLAFAPWPAELHGPTRVALFSLVALAAWTLISVLWSPTAEVAVSDAQRVLVYAVAFVLGAWLCLLLGRRMLLALAPLAGAGAVVAVATLFALWAGSDPEELFEVDATLRFPLGYRNAVAAFFITAILPILTLALERNFDWRLRGALIGSATLSIELAILAQSRTSVFAAVIAIAVLVAAHPTRLRVLGWLALASAPAALALPWLLEVYTHGGGNSAESLEPLRPACGAIALTSLLSAALGCAAARAEPSLELSRETGRRIGIGLAAAVAAIALVGAAAIVRSEGGVGGFIGRSADQLTAGTPDLTEEGSRFGFDLRSQRGDLWRVAIDDFGGSPAIGEGAGGFRPSYLLDRRANDVQPEDPHSVELQMAGELGLPGLLLFGAFVVGAVAAVLRARRLGPSAAALTAGALAVAAYWLAHASVEWFWTYPAVTLPMAFAIGAACAPALLRPAGPPRTTARRGLGVAAVIVAVSFVPPLLSEAYTNDALRTWRTDLGAAYSDLERAADLNPLSDRPLAAEAVIAEEAGEPQRALGALSRAQERVPEEWTLYYLEARILGGIDPASAARPLERARELNPHGAEVDQLEADLGAAAP